MTTLRLTPDNCVIANGLKLCKVEGNQLIFFDYKDRRRRRREQEEGEGGNVRVDILELVRLAVSVR